MSYIVIVDSCGELSSDMKGTGHFETASLSIEVAGHHIVDDETFDQADFFAESERVARVSEIFLPVAGAVYGAVSL